MSAAFFYYYEKKVNINTTRVQNVERKKKKKNEEPENTIKNSEIIYLVTCYVWAFHQNFVRRENFIDLVGDKAMSIITYARSRECREGKLIDATNSSIYAI